MISFGKRFVAVRYTQMELFLSFRLASIRTRPTGVTMATTRFLSKEKASFDFGFEENKKNLIAFLTAFVLLFKWKNPADCVF